MKQFPSLPLKIVVCSIRMLLNASDEGRLCRVDILCLIPAFALHCCRSLWESVVEETCLRLETSAKGEDLLIGQTSLSRSPEVLYQGLENEGEENACCFAQEKFEKADQIPWSITSPHESVDRSLALCFYRAEDQTLLRGQGPCGFLMHGVCKSYHCR
ncbi:protein FAM110B isoform X2 [Lathamus discolor]|uniref:protein FAM110B isoform X2 n=1 Tax=Lathamus discolor TaxID=678569 RepID=UPI0032B786FD